MYTRCQIVGGPTGAPLLFAFVLWLCLGAGTPIVAAGDPNQQPLETKRMPEDFPKEWPETMRIIRSSLSFEDQAARVMQVLNGESIQLGLSRLDEYRMYIYWALYDDSGGSSLPLKPRIGEEDVFYVLANRRFIVLFDRLSKLPKAEAGRAVGDELAAAVRQYQQWWEEKMQVMEFLKRKDYQQAGKPRPHLELIRDDGGPTLVGVRLKVLALLMLAGNLQLQELQPLVTQIVEMGVAQRNQLYKSEANSANPAGPELVQMGLYQRQILATAALGTALEPARQEEVCKKAEADMKRVDLIKNFKECARFPEYKQDLPKEGQLIVSRVGPITDAQFDAIIAEVGKARTQSPR